MDISKIDKNFSNSYSLDGMKMYNVNEKPFKLYGLYRTGGEKDFKRMPKAAAESTGNLSIKALYKNTSGIRVKFSTNSKRIVLRCVLPEVTTFPHMAVTGSSCFDLYADGTYCGVFRPGVDENGRNSDNNMQNGYTSGYVFPDKKQREILINFPLYNNVDEVYIYLEEDANILEAEEYTKKVPFLVYGSSITQGGCASHPGNCYPAMLSRRFDSDFINLGFSAGCKAETEMADYIATVTSSIFIYDYDCNAPTLEYLEKTHEAFFKRVRKANPDLPIIIISRTDASDVLYGEKARAERNDVILKTYKNAVSKGDKNVYFIDGADIFSTVGTENCTVDATHPNDLGFYCMAKAVGDVMEIIYNKDNVG